MAFEYKLQWHMLAGRIAFGVLCVYLGYQIFLEGGEFYTPYLHGARKVVFGAKSKNRISENLTFNDVFKVAV